ncbi:MAG: tyrosine-type recombinase/integrase [Acidobacteria bacterium]|nr:tyrosine-type recombinase/integrase [Acidobacteriota bacterium]
MPSNIMIVEQPDRALEPQFVQRGEQGLSRFFLGEEGERARRFQDWIGNHSANTVRTYRTQWSNYFAWCDLAAVDPVPASPYQVRAWIDFRKCQANPVTGKPIAPNTISQGLAALKALHEIEGLQYTNDYPEIKNALGAIRRQSDHVQRQARGLQLEHAYAIRAVAEESKRRARRKRATAADRRRADRDLVDVAIVFLARDGLLRRSETAALRWSDFEEQSDGSGRILIRKSKTDQEGKGQVRFVSRATVEALKQIRPKGADPEASIFGLSSSTIGARVKRACERAGLGEDFSGHSCRRGMAQDLAAKSFNTAEIANAGGWASEGMVVLYTRHEEAGRSAVARFHEGLGPSER